MASSTTQQSLLDVVNQCDNYPLCDSKDPTKQARLVPLTFHDFMVDGIPVGRIHSTIVPHMAAYNESAAPTFHITDTAVAFMPWMNDYDSRSDAIAQMLVSPFFPPGERLPSQQSLQQMTLLIQNFYFLPGTMA